MQKIILSARASNPYSFNTVGERWGSFEVACMCLKCILLSERLNTFSQTRLFSCASPCEPDFTPFVSNTSWFLSLVCWMGTRTWNINVQKVKYQSRAVFLFWSGQCATFPTACLWFVIPQQVSSGQTSRGKFCVSTKQAHFCTPMRDFLGKQRSRELPNSMQSPCLWAVLQPAVLTRCFLQCLCAQGPKPGNAPPCISLFCALSHNANRNLQSPVAWWDAEITTFLQTPVC